MNDKNDKLICVCCKEAGSVGIKELSDNAWDIGSVSGVLQGIALTPTLLPNQKEAIASALKAINGIGERNRMLVLAATSQS